MYSPAPARGTLLSLLLLTVPALAAPPKPAPGPKPAAGKGQHPSPKFQKARQLLLDAQKLSKDATVKKGIGETLVLLEKKQFKPAEEKVGELKRTAALGGDGDVALKLVSAEDALGDLATRMASKGTSKGKPKK